MLLLIGGDSELAVATLGHLQTAGDDVIVTSRRPNSQVDGRIFLDLSKPLDDWNPPPGTRAVCILAAVARVAACEADPAGSGFINVTQTLALIKKLIDRGIYVLFVSSDQVFDGTSPHMAPDAPYSPVSEYGRQKCQTETGVREHMAKGAPVGILRVAKLISPDMPLLHGWIDALVTGHIVRPFHDMFMAPTPILTAGAAVAALLKRRAQGIFQFTGPRDVPYSDVARLVAEYLSADLRLIQPVSAASASMPIGTARRHTTLDSSLMQERFGLVVPDVWAVMGELLAVHKSRPDSHGNGVHRDRGAQTPVAKVIELDDLVKVAEGVYYSQHPLPLVSQEVIEFLKHEASTSPLRRARFCAHQTPDAEQHDMLIVSHHDTYVTPHRHAGKTETFVVLEGFADIILFDEEGVVEKIVKMGPPSSGQPFFYRMPAGQFHSLAIKSELIVIVESTKGPFNFDDRENASWAPDYNDAENGKAYIASILQ